MNNRMTKVCDGERKLVQDLKCGDVFLFRKHRYLVLSSITDGRHTTAHITTIAEEDSGRLTRVTVLALFRTTKVIVLSHTDVKITILRNEDHEIMDEDVADLVKYPALSLD